MVQFYLVHTLNQLVLLNDRLYQRNTSAVSCLRDDVFESIIDFCLAAMTNASGIKRALILYQEAERTVLDIVRHLVVRLGKAIATNHGPFESTGVHSLLRLIEYFIAVLNNVGSRQPLPRGLKAKLEVALDGFSGKSELTGSGGSGSGSGSGHAVSRNGQGNGNGNLPPLGDLAFDADMQHLTFSLKALHLIVTAWGDTSYSRALFTGLKDFHFLVVNELGSALLTLCTCRDAYPSLVLQLTLSLFSSLYTMAGPAIRVLVECFLKQVYLKALHQIVDIFMSQVCKCK